MSDLTQHVEQLARVIERAGAIAIVCRAEPSMTSFVPLPECAAAARLMTAMAKVLNKWEQRHERMLELGAIYPFPELDEARRELDDLVQKGTH